MPTYTEHLTDPPIGRRAWTIGLGEHWRGTLQIVNAAVTIGCVAATAGTAATACFAAGMALSVALTGVSVYDNGFRRHCWADVGRDAIFNFVPLGLARGTSRAANLEGMGRFNNSVYASGSVTGSALGLRSFCT